MKSFARAKHKSAPAEAAEFCREVAGIHQDFYEERNFAFNDDLSTAPDGAFVQSAKGFGDGGGIDDGVGVDEENSFALSGAGAGVAGGRDFSVIHINDASAVVRSDLGRRVGRGVVDDDDFVGLAGGFGGLVNGLQRSGKARFLVVSWDDE